MPAPAGFSDVSGLLGPRSIAVIGASDKGRNLGGVAVANLTRFGFPGAVWPVHPQQETVAGLPAFPSVAALPAVPDLAIVAVGAARVPEAVREVAEAGGRNVIVWAGGFAEVGKEGAALQDRLVALCRDHGVNLLGPNCLGVLDTGLPLTASFASFLDEIDSMLPGGVTMIGQSGGLVTMAMAQAREAGFGFRYAISTGNEAVLGTADFVAAVADDPRTQVIALYLEGTRDGEKLAAALDLARQNGKPVVVLRGGASAAAARAAAAHTGALAGESRVWRAVLRELGVIEVHSLEELLDVAQQISSNPDRTRMAGTGLAVVTFGGGSGVLSADQAARRGLSVPPLAEATQQRLAPLIPPIASTHNPIDLTPQVFLGGDWLDSLPGAFDTIVSDPGVDGVLLQYGPMAKGAAEVARITKDFIDRAPVPVLLAWPLAPAGVPEWLHEQGVNLFIEYDRAIRVMAHLASMRPEGPGRVAVNPARASVDWSRHVPAASAGRVLTEYDSHRLLAAAGLAVAAGDLVQDAGEVAAAGARLGWPVVVKGMSEAVTHKFAAGLVRLDVTSADAAERAAGEILARAQELGVVLDGLYVQHMLTGEAEILVSSFRDPAFGPMISCGAGGVLTELIDDVVLHRGPVDVATAEAMLRGLRVVTRLKARQARPDLKPMAEFVSAFSHVSAAAPWHRFVFEVNPVKWSDDGAAAVDGLLIVEEP